MKHRKSPTIYQKDREYFLPIFLSAFRNNGNLVDVAIEQVALYTGENRERIRQSLKNDIEKFKRVSVAAKKEIHPDDCLCQICIS